MAKVTAKKTAAKKTAKKKVVDNGDTNYIESYDQMKTIVEAMDKDMQDFDQRGVNAAGGRLRKCAHELVKLGRLFRKQVQNQRAANKAAK